MNPTLAYALFCKGMDTYDIAIGANRTEAEVVEALVRYREQRGRENPPHLKAVGQSQAQDVRV